MTPVEMVCKFFRVTPGPLPVNTGRKLGLRERLPELCADLGYARGVEVGVRDGKFSELFCKAGMSMFCVDPWSPVPNYSSSRQERSLAAAKERLLPLGATLVQKTSMDAVRDFQDGSVDFVHIDGRHEFDFAMEDLIHWSPKIRPGGLLMAHDYHLNGVKHAIDAYTLAHHIDPWFLTKQDQPTAFWIVP